ncbi:MAG TPA: hypothetical protein VF457_13110 [Burkholderiaceae bacterium]
MSKKLTVLAGARRLPRFTVSELGDAVGVPASTVQTVLNRVPEAWFSRSQLQSGARGGQPKAYELTGDGRRGIDALLAALGAPASDIPAGPPPETPLGLLAAEEIRLQLDGVDERAVEALLADAHANLDWARAELDEGLHAGDAAALMQRIALLREELRAIGARRLRMADAAEPAPDGQSRHSLLAIAKERLSHWSSVLSNTVWSPAPAHHVVIGCIGSGVDLRNLAVVACAAVNGAAQAVRARSVDCVIQDMPLEEIDTDFLDTWSDEAEPASRSLVWCINSAEDEGAIQRLLEHRKTVPAPAPAVVLDLAFSPGVETSAATAKVAYAPHAGDGRSAAWVSNLPMF